MNFLELTKLRCAVRSYSDRPVEPEKLRYILECVRMAPSAVNFQPWRFAILTEKESLTAIKSVYNRDWIAPVPCIIVLCADHSESWHRASDGKDHSDIDMGIAIGHLSLAAAEQGLGSCCVCNFNTLLCREIMHLPENIEPVALIPIGYPVQPPVQGEKSRKPISDLML